MPSATSTEPPTATGTFTPTKRLTNTPVGTFNPDTPTTLTLFRDQDTLTLYVPKTDRLLSLASLTFEAVESSGETVQFALQDYPGFRGMPFDDLSPFTPVCFRLVRARSEQPIPLECASIALTLRHYLADADVLWYDSTANQDRLVTVRRDGEVIGLCAAGQNQCEIALPSDGS